MDCETHEWVIVVHGGAGAMRSMGADKEALYREGLDRATRLGARCLADGGQAVDAVVLAVRDMEASGHFNAGHGSCLTTAGKVEVDAAVMNGADLGYGAVAAVPGIGNAVALADAVRQHSAHCLFAGPGALEWAAQLDDYRLDRIEPSPARLAHWRKLAAAQSGPIIGADELLKLGGTHDEGDTVGAVALDVRGGLAAAVSTGGIWMKTPGRVGDSPLAGAGLWAEDNVVACSATGTGEFIMRVALCADIRARCAAGETAFAAGQAALDALEHRFGGDRAGLIALDAAGSISTAFHTAGMGRAWMRRGQTDPTVRVWPEDDTP
ncbi:MAG: isoaspartyl peptidase/L-asparaginase [Myxococcota bacterium]|nr:isoaspartyl peptidase/L-asparaginase [Myxococcota bacterium]